MFGLYKFLLMVRNVVSITLADFLRITANKNQSQDMTLHIPLFISFILSEYREEIVGYSSNPFVSQYA